MAKSTTYPQEQLDKRSGEGQRTRPSDINPRYEELKTLGQGCEGYVYLVRDRSTGRKLVLKILYEPTTKNGLKLYSDSIKSNEYGLHEITLFQESDGVVALQYPFVRLHDVDFEIYSLSSCTAKSLFGQFCLMQWYLMSHHSIYLVDPWKVNFMLAHDGQFHYVDYGRGLRRVADPPALAGGRFGFAFAALLLDVHNINLELEIPYSSSYYSYSKPCIYNMCDALDIVAAEHIWVRKILSEVRSHNASIFLDPEFYWRVGMSLPRRVCLPQLVILTSKLIKTLRIVRDRVRTKP